MRNYVLEQGGAWDGYLLLIEFTYNNSFHFSIEMALYEALYSGRCRTTLYWYELGGSVVLGYEIVHQATEKTNMIQEKMKRSQSCQKKLL